MSSKFLVNDVKSHLFTQMSRIDKAGDVIILYKKTKSLRRRVLVCTGPRLPIEETGVFPCPNT